MSHPVFSAGQIKAVDAATIAGEPVSSLHLMERAARACVEAFRPHLSPLLQHHVHVFCGPGNNGGDGLAIARMLREVGYHVFVYLVPFKALTPEAEANRKLLTDIHTINGPGDLPEIFPGDTVIDALLGIGAGREPDGILKTVIGHINGSGSGVLAVDLPSGLPADSIPTHETIVKANFTATFQFPKLTFFLPETAGYVGRWGVADIGLSGEAIHSQQTQNFHLGCLPEQLLLPRSRFTHKGTYGHGLLIAGSKGKMGAATLAAKAALRSGAGLLTVHTPGSGLNVLQVAVPEAMCSIDDYDDHIASFPVRVEAYAAVGMGPGIGKEEDTLFVLRQLLTAHGKVVLDADALNLLAENTALLERLPEQTVLTPHPKEFGRLFGETTDSVERLQLLRESAQKHRCTIVLKDAITAIATPDGNVFFNTTGNPGMATGGSGDVLTGIVLGLLTQGYPAETAAKIAVYFHGKAGDDAAIVHGQNGLIAGDLIQQLRIERKDK